MTRFEFPFGIEEEFFVSHPQTGELVVRDDGELVRAARRQLGNAVTWEMLQSQLEIVSPVFHHVAEADATMYLPDGPEEEVRS